MSGPRNVDLNPLVLSHFSRNNKKKKKTAMKCDRVLQKFFLSTKAKNKEEKRGINQKQGMKKKRDYGKTLAAFLLSAHNCSAFFTFYLFLLASHSCFMEFHSSRYALAFFFHSSFLSV